MPSSRVRSLSPSLCVWIIIPLWIHFQQTATECISHHLRHFTPLGPPASPSPSIFAHIIVPVRLSTQQIRSKCSHVVYDNRRPYLRTRMPRLHARTHTQTGRGARGGGSSSWLGTTTIAEDSYIYLNPPFTRTRRSADEIIPIFGYRLGYPELFLQFGSSRWSYRYVLAGASLIFHNLIQIKKWSLAINFWSK